MKKLAFVLVLALPLAAVAPTGRVATSDSAAWEQRATRVTIVRDDWGIAHIHGKSDADAVFGLMYAQAEDDFSRVETNFLNAMGRLAEAEGETEIYRDLRMKLFINPDSMRVQYAASPAWLKALMIAWADGLNFYLAKHPEVKPRVITRFEPWMALSFSEGSIGGDIEKVNLTQLEAFYGGKRSEAPIPNGGPYVPPAEPGGSNGIAISPTNTVNGRALLLINPHTSFFFRSEVQVTSDEGLNAYGAVTWGQFFIYQGFNAHTGWMHTTSGGDDLDEYLETVTKKGDGFTYKYGSAQRAVATTRITVPYTTAHGMSKKEFTVYRTHHGPVIREASGKWVTIRIMQEPLKALTQSYSRTKTRDYKSFRQTMELHTNSSNNTIFADADGDIAYFHSNFIPKRDPKFDWTNPVDGADPATEWQGLLGVDESPKLLNPASGWLFNVNNWPWTSAGASSPRKADFPTYVEMGGESARGLHAIRVLQGKKDFSIPALIAAAYDSYLPAFTDVVPAVIKDYDQLAAASPLKARLADQIAMFKGWDLRWSATSVPTSLAVYWGEDLSRRVSADARRAHIPVDDYMVSQASPDQRLQALAAASDKLAADFGTWMTPWGDINRFQRLTGDIVQPFTDAGASIPVAFTSARWGSLASFGARTYKGTKKMYGTSGNSFVAVVEFGKDSVRAKAITAGGESGDPASKHFNDQAQRYATGALRDVYFYPSQLKGHTERTYHPGS